MLSILLPIYNFDCRELVRVLHQQAVEANIIFEIIGLDDASKEEFVRLNSSIVQIAPNIHYELLRENIGRSRIRNVLARKAQFDYLLFMDCDSKVVERQYIQQYVQHVKEDTLLYGGRVYDDQQPENHDFILHWTFGRQREQSTAKVRAQNPYHSFMTNNFVIPKAIFERIQFDESITQYGHEDTLFGLALKRNNMAIQHLDNPLEHIGLEETTTFLRKTEVALENLAKLHLAGKSIETKLLQVYQRIQKLGGDKLLHSSFQASKKHLKRRLFAKNPSLFYFDLYKLGTFSEKMKILKP